LKAAAFREKFLPDPLILFVMGMEIKDGLIRLPFIYLFTYLWAKI
jgi:hypothetical protein